MRFLPVAATVVVFGAVVASCASTGGARIGGGETGGPPSALATSSKAGWGPHGKPLYYFMVLSNAAPGREDEFNRWYDRIHAPIVIEEGDFVWTQRFELSPDQFAGNGTPELKTRQFMVIFAIETNDIKGSLAAVNKRLAEYRNVQSSSMTDLQAVSWKALGPPTTQADAVRLLAEEEAAGRVPKKGTPAPPGFKRQVGGPGAGGPPPGGEPPPGVAPPTR